MTELTIAVIAGLVTIGVSVIAAYGVVRGLSARLQRDNALLYLWNRQLVDHIYRGSPAPPPPPPPGLFE